MRPAHVRFGIGGAVVQPYIGTLSPAALREFVTPELDGNSRVHQKKAMAFPLINCVIFSRFGGSSPCKRFVGHDRDAWPISSFWRVLEEARANMAVARVHNRRERRHAGVGKQPGRRQIQGWQGTLPTAAVRAVPLGSKPNGWCPRQARSALVAIVTIRRCQDPAAKRAKMYQMNLYW